MQEIRTLTTIEVTTPNESVAFDDIVNALLADGWAILTACVTTTTGPVHTFASLILVRETQPAPVETPYPFKVGDRVKVTHAEIASDAEFVGKVGRITSLDAEFNEINVDFDGREAMMISAQLEHADTIPF